MQVGDGLYEWTPGDGSLYALVLADTSRGKAVVWLKNAWMGGPAFLVTEDAREELGIHYFMQKSGIEKREDAANILAFLQDMKVIERYYT